MREIVKSIFVGLFVLMMIAFPTGYLFVHDNYERQIFETVLWTLLIIFSTLIHIFYPEKKKISWAILFFALFISYIILNCYLKDRGTLRLTLYIGALVLGITGMRSFFSNYFHRIHSLFIIAGSLIFTSYFVFFSYSYFFPIQESKGPYQQNPSLFGILLAAQLLFFLPIWWEKRKNIPNFFNWVIGVTSGFAIFLLSISDGRAGWLGLLTGVIYLCYQSIRIQQYKKRFLVLSFAALIASVIILIYYKHDSSQGRELIYKVSYGMFANHPWTGTGAYGFSAEYNQYQANYFTSHSIDGKEALLADNNWFAFNDYYQFAIENGLLGVSLLLVLVFLLINKKRLSKNVRTEKNSYSAIASLISILTAALFSYPLQFFPVVFQMVVCVSVMSAKPVSFTSKNNERVVFPFLMIVAGIILIAGNSFLLQFNLKEQKAYAAEQTGMLMLSLQNYGELQVSFFADGNQLYHYSRTLYTVNRLEEASVVMQQAKLKYVSNQVYKLSGLIHQGLGQNREAEADFRNAVFMVPNRIINRYDLLSFYVTQHDTAAIRFWSNSILSMPIKVPSNITRHLQQSSEAIQRRFLMNDETRNQ